MDATAVTGRYGFGTGFWDAAIFQYVPGQIVGYGVKEALQFKFSVFSPLWARSGLTNLYGYDVPLGSTFTGIGDSFVEFGYLGCILFAMIGYLFKTLWVSSNSGKSVPAMLLHMSLFSPAMVSITHGVGRFAQEAPFQIIVVMLILQYATASVDKPQTIQPVVKRILPVRHV